MMANDKADLRRWCWAKKQQEKTITDIDRQMKDKGQLLRQVLRENGCKWTKSHPKRGVTELQFYYQGNLCKFYYGTDNSLVCTMVFSAAIDGTNEAFIVKVQEGIKLFNERYRAQIESFREEFLDEDTNEVVTMMDLHFYCWVVVDFAEMLIDANQTFHQIFQDFQALERQFVYYTTFYDDSDN